MSRQAECEKCGKLLLFFYTDEHLRMAPFELVERGSGVYGAITNTRASRNLPSESRDLTLHDCKGCICITLGDLGFSAKVGAPTDIAYRHADCPQHGGEMDDEG